MRYQNAKLVLPKPLLQEIQQYVQGSYLYIPKPSASKRKWGDGTDTKQLLRERNQAILQAYRQGTGVEELAEQYFLTRHSIRRIIREQP